VLSVPSIVQPATVLEYQNVTPTMPEWASLASAFHIWLPATRAPSVGAVMATAGLLRSMTMLAFESQADAPTPLCAVALTQTFVPSGSAVTFQSSE